MAQSFSEKFWHDKHGKFVVYQRPNFLLWIWIVTFVLNIILPGSSLERLISYVGEIALLIWAFLELFRGVNYFRRTLGFGVILLMAVSRFL